MPPLSKEALRAIGAITDSKLVVRARRTLFMTQKEFAPVIRCSHRNVIRIENGQAALYRDDAKRLAQALFPVNRAVAAEVAARLGVTLESLGLADPPAPPEPAPPVSAAPPPPPEPVAPAPSPAPPPPVEHLVDSIVCAAAEAVTTTPQAIRPALAAAFARAVSLGLAVDAVDSALSPKPVIAPVAKPKRKSA